jgi:twin arginine-targeting protein translocase, TatA/E family
MGNIGVWELIIIAILVVVIFGGKRLPELGRGLGKGLANFRQAVREPDSPGRGQTFEASPAQSGAESVPAGKSDISKPEGGQA